MVYNKRKDYFCTLFQPSYVDKERTQPGLCCKLGNASSCDVYLTVFELDSVDSLGYLAITRRLE